LASTLAGLFGAIALVLAGLGLYGVIAGTVERRWREIGVRAALGATPARLVRLVLREAALLLTCGIAVGVALALGASRLVSALLYGVTPHDAVTLITTVLILAALGALAAWIPARRASRVDPAITLRSE
jgi:ABC-type antimicrobial peptide transport system permease subunit